VLTNSLTSIGNYAFYQCEKLQSITLPYNLASIGEGGFYNCSNLTSIMLPNSITTIERFTFRGCAKLNSITLPSNLINIGINAFLDCASLGSISFPNSLTSIGMGAFLRCYNLSSITFSNSLTNIAPSAFRYCTALTSITLPNSLVSIGANAFNGCEALTTVTIPENVTSIGEVSNETYGGAFSNCNSLNTVNYNAKNCTHLFSELNQSIFKNSPIITLNIGNMVQIIPERAFEGCSSLTSITTYAVAPPTISFNAFSNIPTNIPVYVPCRGYNSYVNASGWSDYFTNIIVGTVDKQQICMISVDVNNHNEIIWKKQEEVFFYRIYREGIQSGQYDLVATVDYNAPNIWVDTESNAKIRSYRYKIGGVCNNVESILSDPHKTMHLTINAGQNNSWNLIWTAYEGTAYSTYNIYRTSGDTPSEFSLIGTMPAGGNTSFSDFGAPAGYVYYIVEIMLNENCDLGKANSSIKSNMASNNPNVSVSENEMRNIRVYPNPTIGKLQVTSDELEVTSIEVFDIYGRNVFTATETTLNISHLSVGIYFVKIRTESGEVVKKVVKE